jgi:uncharacterized protein YciI
MSSPHDEFAKIRGDRSAIQKPLSGGKLSARHLASMGKIQGTLRISGLINLRKYKSAVTRQAHLARLAKLAEEGAIAITGRIAEEGDLRGVIIFSVGAEQAAKLLQDDPLVKTGYLKPELHPWITAKGVLSPRPADVLTAASLFAFTGQYQFARATCRAICDPTISHPR